MNREKVKEYYNHYIDEVLKIYIKKYAEVRWLNSSELILKKSKNRIPWQKKITDPYIYNSSQDKKILGKDIIKHGTYFPIFITKNNIVMMGVHRVESLKIIKSDKKLMCVVLNENHFDKSRTDKPKYEYKTPNTIDKTENFKVPKFIVIPEDARMDEYIILRESYLKFRGNNEYIILKVENFRDILDILKIVPHWIKNYFYEQQKKGLRIEARKCINSMEEYNNWIID